MQRAAYGPLGVLLPPVPSKAPFVTSCGFGGWSGGEEWPVLICVGSGRDGGLLGCGSSIMGGGGGGGSDPTQHAKGRTGDRPGPRKETATRRNVTRGGGGWSLAVPVVDLQGTQSALGGSAQHKSLGLAQGRCWRRYVPGLACARGVCGPGAGGYHGCCCPRSCACTVALAAALGTACGSGGLGVHRGSAPTRECMLGPCANAVPWCPPPVQALPTGGAAFPICRTDAVPEWGRGRGGAPPPPPTPSPSNV